MTLPVPSTDPPSALTIAGFDPSSGAGITADLLVFAAHGIFATTAITATTVQNTRGVRSVQSADATVLIETLACLEEDLPPLGIKIGMLADEQHVLAVAEYLQGVRRKREVTVVLDPVIRSSSGADLLSAGGFQALVERLLPLVDAVTPNLAEAEMLTGLPCTTPGQMEMCARALRSRYPQLRVVVTGGHLKVPSDLFLDEDGAVWFAGERVVTNATHGTGCAFSSALLAFRLNGEPWPACVQHAKAFVRSAMLNAVPRGAGKGPLKLFR